MFQINAELPWDVSLLPFRPHNTLERGQLIPPPCFNPPDPEPIQKSSLRVRREEWVLLMGIRSLWLGPNTESVLTSCVPHQRLHSWGVRLPRGQGDREEEARVCLKGRLFPEEEIHDPGPIHSLLSSPREALTIFFHLGWENGWQGGRESRAPPGPFLRGAEGSWDRQFPGPGLESVQQGAWVHGNRRGLKMAFRGALLRAPLTGPIPSPQSAMPPIWGDPTGKDFWRKMPLKEGEQRPCLFHVMGMPIWGGRRWCFQGRGKNFLFLVGCWFYQTILWIGVFSRVHSRVRDPSIMKSFTCRHASG